jgi:hypothetical protein
MRDPPSWGEGTVDITDDSGDYVGIEICGIGRLVVESIGRISRSSK